MTARERWTLVAAVLGSGVVFLDSTVVTVALPAIGQALPTPRLGVLEAQSYVYNAYLLSLSALLVLAGALGDRQGRRRWFLRGLVGFGVASALCGLAPTMEALIVARLLQGAAGAVLVPASLALITTTFHGEGRGRAFGIWAGTSAATTILGPLVGGAVVDLWSWRWVFLLNLPLAVAGVVVTLAHVEESRDLDAVGSVDVLGSLVVIVALGGLTFGAIRGQEQAWQDPTAFVALGLGLVASAVFVPLMARSRSPLVPLGLFRSRNFLVTNLSTLAIYGSLYVTMYVMVLFLQGTLGYTAAAAGLATIPSVVFLALFSGRVGTLAARHGPRAYMAVGPAVMAAGALLLSRVASDLGPWALDLSRPATWAPPGSYVRWLLPGLVLYGIGIMIVVAPLTTTLMTSVSERRAGLASAINNALSRVGPQLATAALVVALTATFGAALGDRLSGTGVDVDRLREQASALNPPPEDAPAPVQAAVRAASEDAFRLAMLVGAVLAAVGAVVNGAGIRNPVAPEAVTGAPGVPGATAAPD
jgi:EmrB/QacA subfamily drug resistance transporter